MRTSSLFVTVALGLAVSSMAPPLSAADSGYGEPPQIDKATMKAMASAESRMDTASRLADLAKAAPGRAVGMALQSVNVPGPSDSGFAVLVRVVSARADYRGIFSDLEMQILSEAAIQLPKWSVEAPKNRRVISLKDAFGRLYRNACQVEDLTALGQRRSLCELLHDRGGMGDGRHFSDSAKAKRFQRRELQLANAGAAKGNVPLPSDPADNF
jgi:hypothetical protein